jgi:hypothetical protein
MTSHIIIKDNYPSLFVTLCNDVAIQLTSRHFTWTYPDLKTLIGKMRLTRIVNNYLTMECPWKYPIPPIRLLIADCANSIAFSSYPARDRHNFGLKKHISTYSLLLSVIYKQKFRDISHDTFWRRPVQVALVI